MFNKHHSSRNAERHLQSYGGWRRPKYNVPVNIAETESSYEITVYATGFRKENIKISLADDVLYISGTRSIDENDPPHFLSQEFPVKSFERMITITKEVDRSNIKARQEDQVLIISLPKSAEALQPPQDIAVA
jgi:HSP20 family protein